MTTAEKAYAAGIFDGEAWMGFASPGPKRGRTRPQIEVTSVDPELVEWLHRVVGGYRPKTVERGGNRQPEHRWRAGGREAQRILAEVAPFLVIERRRDVAAKMLLW